MKNNSNSLRKKIMRKYLWSTSISNYLRCRLSHSENYYIYKFMLNLRQYERLLTHKTTPVVSLKRFWYASQYQKYSMYLGYVIGDGVLGEDITFYHRGNIVINPSSRIGDGCRFHGDCCIGVAKTGEVGCPVLGKNVDIGVGAKILGEIYIADGITIGANSVVVDSFY